MTTHRTLAASCPHYLMFHAATKDLKLITGRSARADRSTLEAAGWCMLDMW
jgi:hypothetical protein